MTDKQIEEGYLLKQKLYEASKQSKKLGEKL